MSQADMSENFNNNLSLERDSNFPPFTINSKTSK
jgi:hypothetical protein